MTRQESISIVDKIQVYRQSFLITNRVYEEWFKVLEPYDYEDVDRKLDEYFRDSDNFGRYPDVYYLTKYLKTIEQKKDDSILHVNCQLCNRKIKYEDYKKHYERCSSADYIVEMAKRYFNQNLSKDKMLESSEKKFQSCYYSFCKKLYEVMPDGFPKHLLENVLLTYEGKEPNLNLQDIAKEIKDDARINRFS